MAPERTQEWDPGSPSALPLAGFRIIDTPCAEEAEHILSRQLSRLRIVSAAHRARFRLQMNAAHLGRVLVGFNLFDVHTIVDPGRLDDAFILSFGNETPSVITVDGQAVVATPTSASMLSPSSHLRIERPAGSGVFLIRASPRALAERFQRLTEREPPAPLRFTREVDLSAEPGATVLRVVRFVISELESIGPGPIDPADRSALQDLLLSALLMLPNNHSDLLTADYRGQIPPPLVRMAEELMAARTGEKTTITDLLEICGCSRSVLFEAFRRYRNYTPMQFLMTRRMEKAREALLSGSESTVTSVALDCGFTHLSRFAGAYRARFGELPSETLEKNRRSAPQPEN